MELANPQSGSFKAPVSEGPRPVFHGAEPVAASRAFRMPVGPNHTSAAEGRRPRFAPAFDSQNRARLGDPYRLSVDTLWQATTSKSPALLLGVRSSGRRQRMDDQPGPTWRRGPEYFDPQSAYFAIALRTAKAWPFSVRLLA